MSSFSRLSIKAPRFTFSLNGNIPPSVSLHLSKTAACPSITLTSSVLCTRSSISGSVLNSLTSICTSCWIFLCLLRRHHIPVNEIIVATLVIGYWVHLLQCPYFVYGHPPVLPCGCVTAHSCGIIPS